MKKEYIIGIISAVIVIVFAVMVYNKEKIRNSDNIFYLELRPQDPRSLMQGDYMILRYRESCKDGYDKYNAIIKIDENKIGHYAGIYQDDVSQEVQQDEIVIKCDNRKMLIPNEFFFEEGTAGEYQGAKYALFKYSSSKDYLLVDLVKDLPKDLPENIPVD